jgi:hypothetical protein
MILVLIQPRTCPIHIQPLWGQANAFGAIAAGTIRSAANTSAHQRRSSPRMIVGHIPRAANIPPTRKPNERNCLGVVSFDIITALADSPCRSMANEPSVFPGVFCEPIRNKSSVSVVFSCNLLSYGKRCFLRQRQCPSFPK